MMNFLKVTSEMSTLRVCMFLITCAICFHICWATVDATEIHWWEIGVLFGVVLYGKVEQKKVEAEENRLL